MNKFISLGLVLIMFCLVACGGSSVEGTYYNVDNQNEYIELKKDGVFYLKAGALDFSGTYSVEGDVITLNPGSNLAARGKIERGMITDNDGTRWQKK